MRRTLRLPLLLVALATLSAGSASVARAEDDDARTKTFKDLNFRLRIPESWTWDELSDADKEAGFAVIARRTVRENVDASVRVRVTDAGSTSLESFLGQIKDAKTKALQGVVAEETELDWAGVPARRLQVSGKYEGGGAVAFESYGAIVEGKFHQLDIRCINGAEESLREEMNDLASGYELLSKPGGGAEGGDEAARTKTFSNLGLRWTLPKTVTLPPAKEDEPGRTVQWGWDQNAGKPDLAKGAQGLLARCGISSEGPSPVVMELVLHPERPGHAPESIVNNAGNFDEMEKNFSDQPAPRIDTDVEIGNWRGASRSLNGKDKQDPPKPLYIKVWFATLKGAVYQLTLIAHDDAEKTFRDQIQALLASLHWDDTKEGIRGPWVMPFPSYTAQRKDVLDQGKDATFTSGGLQLKKPAAFGRVKFDATSQPFGSWVFASEARKEGAYAFVGVQRFDAKRLADEKKSPEALIDELESEWKNAMGEPVTLTQRSNKANKRPDSIGGGKGFAYEFRGTKDGAPFVERGWAVKAGPYVFLVRVQVGGAEAALAAEVKSLTRTIKLG